MTTDMANSMANNMATDIATTDAAETTTAANEPFIYNIPTDELLNVEEFAFGTLHMDRDTVMEDFDDVYEDTRARCFENFKCQGMDIGFPIASIEDGVIELECGVRLESPFLAKMCARADELVVYAAVVHGYDELAVNPDNDMFDNMFLNAWGIGFTMACHRWIQKHVAERAAQVGRFTGRGWTPGENTLELSLQSTLFGLLNPTRIGITLAPTKMMRPAMTISAFLGVSADQLIETDGADEVSCH